MKEDLISNRVCGCEMIVIDDKIYTKSCERHNFILINEKVTNMAKKKKQKQS